MKKLNKIKLYLFLLFLIIIVLFFFLNSNNNNTSITNKKEELIIPTQHILEKPVIIKQLTENLQIVGLESTIEKEYMYSDIEWYGERIYSMKLNGKFKMGININDISYKNVTVTNNNDIIIDMPQVILISLELPFDKIEINKDVGFLRRDFTEADRQLLYREAYKIIEQEILNNENIKNNTIITTQKAIGEVLTLIPDVNNIIFR